MSQVLLRKGLQNDLGAACTVLTEKTIGNTLLSTLDMPSLKTLGHDRIGLLFWSAQCGEIPSGFKDQHWKIRAIRGPTAGYDPGFLKSAYQVNS